MLSRTQGNWNVRWLFLAIGLAISAGPAVAQSDGQIRQTMIRESLASYPGNCPCPYNADRAGRACGARSAYSRPGGRSPLCYPDDISEAMLGEYKRRNGLSR